VLAYSPTLADRVALITSDRNPVRIALALVKVIRPEIYDKLLAVAVYRDKVSKAETSYRPLSSLKPGPIRHEIAGSSPYTCAFVLRCTGGGNWDAV